MDDATPGVPDVGEDDGSADADARPAGHGEERVYRVLGAPPDAAGGAGDADELLLAAEGEAVTVAAGDDDPLADVTADLEAGNRVRARLDWTDRPARFATLAVLDRTRLRFDPDAAPLFEAAVACWESARAADEPMASDLLRNSGGDVVGVVYAFADGAGDLFGEFRDGRRPLDPLLDRIGGADPPYEAFVLDPREYPCVVVAIALDPGSVFASTMRSTYA